MKMLLTNSAFAASFVVMTLVLGGGPSKAEKLIGDPVKMGAGTARTFVDLDASGNPSVIGVELSGDAIEGLPPLKNATSRCFDMNKNGKIDGTSECEGDLELKLALPADAAKRNDIPFEWVAINWNAEGHPPAPWLVPHFDFHFYIASFNKIALIRVGGCPIFINCDDQKLAVKPVPAKYVAPDHINVDAAVGRMGNHLIDVRTPELAKPPMRAFTHTWIYGAFDGRIIFYEPMITVAFLLSRPNVCTPIRQPQAWQKAGYYPTQYCIRYAQADGSYTVSLEGLVERAAE